MQQSISQSQFIDAFRDYGREDNFSYDGLCALYDMLEECCPDFELDVIAICCDFCEYDSFEELANDYDVSSVSELHNNTMVLELDNGGLVIQQY